MIDFNFQHQQGSFTLTAQARLDNRVTGIFGPSGAGKSTLLGIIAGLIKPTSGYLKLDSNTIFDRSSNLYTAMHQRRIGVVFQDSRLFPHLNVQDNLLYGYHLLKAAERRLSFAHIVELLELTPLLTQKPHQLSGGEKQRVALGRALLTSPRLLLLDEPLASLDMRLKQQILPFLRRVKQDINIPMLYVSHAIDEILYLTSQVAMMQRGEIVAAGEFHEVVQNPQALSLVHSLGLENVLHAEVQAHLPDEGYTATLIGAQPLLIPVVTTAPGERISLSITAANIALATYPNQGITIQNQLAATVTAIQQVGHRTLVTCQLAGSEAKLIAEVTAHAIHQLKIEPNKPLYCLIKTQSIHALASLQ